MREEFKFGGQFDSEYENSPEGSAEAKEREEKIREIETLLNPRQETSALLFNRIKEQVYQGKEDSDEREKMVKKHGYDPDFLEKQGVEIEKELSRLSKKEKLPLEKAETMEFLLGLKYSGSVDIRDKVSKHSSLSVGLAYELVRQMRKIVMATAETDKENQKQALAQGGMPPVFEFNIENFVRMAEDKQKYKERTNDVLSLIHLHEKRDQYETALSVLNSEKKQRSRQKKPEFTPHKFQGFS